MYKSSITLLIISAFFIPLESRAVSEQKVPADLFRVSAVGTNSDNAIKEASFAISRTCAPVNYIIVKKWIDQSTDGSSYHVVVTARCSA